MARFKRIDQSIGSKEWCKSYNDTNLNCARKYHIVLVIFSLVSHIGAEPAWFQICDATQKYELNTVDCHVGLWLNQTIDASCVCVNGVWIISSDLCDKNVMLLVGSGDCFNIDKSIRVVKFIGDQNSPFAPATYVVSQDFDSFVKVTSEKFSPSVASTSSLVVSINSKEGVQRSDKEVCLKVGNKNLHRPVHVWKNGRRVSDRFKAVKLDECSASTDYDFHVGFGEILQDFTVLADMSTNICENPCLSLPVDEIETSPVATTIKPILVRKDIKPKRKKKEKTDAKFYHDSKLQRWMTRAEYEAAMRKSSLKTNQRSRTNIRWNRIFSVKKKLSFEADDKLTEEEKARKFNTIFSRARENMSMHPLGHARETREQSLRMIQAYTNSLLLDHPSAKVNTHEYDYFQRIRRIFLAVAPKDFFPPRMMNGFMRMWRLLVWEAHDKFMHRESPNPALHNRILKNLDECLRNLSTKPIFFAKGKKSTAKSSHGCPEETKFTWWVEQNDTKKNKVRYNQNLDILIPDHLRYNVTALDACVELAWKMFEFTYYKCSVYFQTSATDHSEMAEKMQSLFSHQILKRWFEPEDFNKAILVIFPTFDIDLFGWATDVLIGTARQTSGWVQWLARPVRPMTPPDIPHKMRWKRSPKRITSKPLKKSGKDHHQRFHYNFWKNRATCIKSFTDPVEVFGYQPADLQCYVNRIHGSVY